MNCTFSLDFLLEIIYKLLNTCTELTLWCLTVEVSFWCSDTDLLSDVYWCPIFWDLTVLLSLEIPSSVLTSSKLATTSSTSSTLCYRLMSYISWIYNSGSGFSPVLSWSLWSFTSSWPPLFHLHLYLCHLFVFVIFIIFVVFVIFVI